MNAMSFSQWVLVFALASFAGWAMETVMCSVQEKQLVKRGFLSGPWCPIYGFGVVLILLAARPFSRWPPLVFVVAAAAATVLEYFTSWLMEALFKKRWWDYSHCRFNINGRICLKSTLFFGLLGILVVYTQPYILRLMGHLPTALVRVVACVIVVALLLDLLNGLALAAHLKERRRGTKRAIAQMETYQQDYAWHQPDNIPGSILRLREICAAQPGNEVACGIASHIDAELAKGKSSVGLVQAFPAMRPKADGIEFTPPQKEWIDRGGARQRGARRALLALKTRLGATWAEARLSYRGITATRMVWVFLLGSVIGYVLETVICLLSNGVLESRQGMLYGPFNQVYGFGAVVMVLLLTPLVQRGNGWLFAGGALAGGLFEAGCSLIQEVAFGSVSWNYSDNPLSMFGGRTNLPYMMFWGLLAVAYMNLIYPRMSDMIDRIPKRPKRFFTAVIVVLLAANMLLSALAVGRWAERNAGLPAQTAAEAWLDRQYPDKMLEEIYPSMDFGPASEKGGGENAG